MNQKFIYHITDARGTRTFQASANWAEYRRALGDGVSLADATQAADELAARIAANSLEWERDAKDYIPIR